MEKWIGFGAIVFILCMVFVSSFWFIFLYYGSALIMNRWEWWPCATIWRGVKEEVGWDCEIVRFFFREPFRWMPFIYFLSSLSHFCLILLWIIVLSFLFSFLFSSKLKHWSEVGIWIKSMPRCFLLLDKSARIWDVYGMLGTCCIVVLCCCVCWRVYGN